MSRPITPALSAAEWAGVLANRKSLDSIRDHFMDTPFSPHALAALLLYDEPHGFTAQDVEDEREVAVYCRMMVKQHLDGGNAETADTFRLLGERHEIRANKIAALLPPTTSSRSSSSDTPPPEPHSRGPHP